MNYAEISKHTRGDLDAI